jgi:hypothetical protein
MDNRRPVRQPATLNSNNQTQANDAKMLGSNYKSGNKPNMVKDDKLEKSLSPDVNGAKNIPTITVKVSAEMAPDEGL